MTSWRALPGAYHARFLYHVLRGLSESRARAAAPAGRHGAQGSCDPAADCASGSTAAGASSSATRSILEETEIRFRCWCARARALCIRIR